MLKWAPGALLIRKHNDLTNINMQFNLTTLSIIMTMRKKAFEQLSTT